jgi:hypothetical protein
VSTPWGEGAAGIPGGCGDVSRRPCKDWRKFGQACKGREGGHRQPGALGDRRGPPRCWAHARHSRPPDPRGDEGDPQDLGGASGPSRGAQTRNGARRPCEFGGSPVERRDAVALLFAAALRRSELAGLGYARPGVSDGYLQLTAEAIEIVLLRSKTRTEPATVLVPRENNPGLVAALERWIAVAGIRDGEPLFRSIKKGGHIRGRLRDGGVSLALKARIARYLEGSGYTRGAVNTLPGASRCITCETKSWPRLVCPPDFTFKWLDIS